MPFSIQPLLDRDGSIYMLDTNIHEIIIPGGFSFDQMVKAQKEYERSKTNQRRTKRIGIPTRL